MEKETTYESSTEPQSLSRKNIITYTVVAAVLLAAGIAAGYAVGLGLRSSQQTAVNNSSASNSSISAQGTSLAKSIERIGDLSVGQKWDCKALDMANVEDSRVDICGQLSLTPVGDQVNIEITRIAEGISETGETESEYFVLGKTDAESMFIYHLNVTGSAYIVYTLYDTNPELVECQYVDGLGWKDIFPRCVIDVSDSVGRETK